MISQCLNDDCWYRLASYLAQFQFNIRKYRMVSTRFVLVITFWSYQCLPGYFSNSDYATHHLKEELKKEKDQCDIQVVGATCFLLFSTDACRISCCLHPIQCCLPPGTVKFDMAAVSIFLISVNRLHCWMESDKIYLEPGQDCLKFQLDLHNVNELLTPIACSLETLEGQNTTCSDVFHIYIGIAVNFVAMFSDRSEERRVGKEC